MVEIFRAIVNVISAIAIPMFILVFLGWGIVKKIKVYEMFIEGAKDGFNTAVKIIPYLVAMLVAIGIFRASGAMDFVVAALSPVTNLIGMPAEVLPLGLLRPLSGSGSMGLMTELMKTHGPDSFIGVLASTMFGSSETTFYILAVYFGSVGIKNTRHALPAGLIADLFGMLGALFIVKILFGV
jgi:spore maturation protein B